MQVSPLPSLLIVWVRCGQGGEIESPTFGFRGPDKAMGWGRDTD